MLPNEEVATQRAEEELRDSRDHLASIIESAMDSIITVDEHQRILLFNAAAERMFRCAAEEALGQPIERFIPQRYREAHAGHIQRFGRTGLTNRSMGALGSLWARRSDGEEFQIEASISQAVSGAKRLFTVILRDVTERIRIEDALKKSLEASEKALRELADQRFALDQHADVTMTDVEGNITYVNDRFCILSKYSREELIGQNHRIIRSGQHSKEFFSQMYNEISNGRVWHGEVCNRAKDGSLYWVDTTIVPFLGLDGAPRQYVAIRTDITQRKEAARALAHKAEELAQSNQDLEQFAYVASHDLQEPLRMVAAYTQLLAERYQGRLDSQADKYIHYATDGATRMQTLIQDLLRYSRTGRREMELKNTDFRKIVEQSLVNLQAAIQESNAIVKCDALPILPVDSSQLTQVFQNLIGNAIKFRSKSGPVIQIRAEQNGGDWVFAVEDNGIGISPEQAKEIFVLFKRLHSREEYPGNGIGLATCKRIIERHGGRIWVESQPDGGSCFSFTLPLEEHGRDGQQLARC